MTRLLPAPGIDYRFLAHQLHYLWMGGYFRHRCTNHVNQASVSAETLSSSVPVILAPTAQQASIVEAIDSYLSRLDDAVASLTRAQKKLKAYRASVLKAAVEGRLVPTEAELARQEKRSFEPASELLKRILKERRRRWEEAELAKLKAAGKTPKDDKWKAKYEEPAAPDTSKLPKLPEGWCWASVDQLSYLLRNGQSSAPREERGVRTLRISAVRPLLVDFEDVRYLPGSPEDYPNDLIEVGDLLFTRYNGTPSLVGVCGRVRSLTEPTVHPDKLIKVRLLSHLHSPYIEIAANAGESRLLVERRTRTTAGQAGISGSDLKQMPIPVPPLTEQVRIADEVERLLSVADTARATVMNDERRCARLRQSVLKWAFEGKLVDQDPNDEPAEALLARIRAEQTKSGNAKPAKPTRGRKAKAAS
jgi:type I restriction enzyme S subunit